MTGRTCAACAAIAVLMTACTRTRDVKLAWDAPTVLPARYHILIDSGVVQDIAPPPVDQSCNCLRATVRVRSGEHTIRVDACNRAGVCTPSAEVAVR